MAAKKERSSARLYGSGSMEDSALLVYKTANKCKIITYWSQNGRTLKSCKVERWQK